MKKNFFLLACAVIALAACESDTDALCEPASTHQPVTFRCSGDFDSPTFTPVTRSVCGDIIATTTRAAVTADGKEMTDLYVLDYMDGQLIQQLHQTADDTDFGEPTLTLDYGQHHVYFVCSRGKTPTLSTDDHTITWATPSDTFYKDYTVAVSSSTATTHSVTLDRAATRLSVTLNDAIPEGLATVDVAPATWYYGIDYLTGLPADQRSDEPTTITVPSSRVGRTNTTLSVYSLSGATEWTTDVTVTARDQDDDIIGQATITAAPFKANRTTAYSGSLFASSGGFALTLNADWATDYTATW